jgi:hypothetical protein
MFTNEEEFFESIHIQESFESQEINFHGINEEKGNKIKVPAMDAA